MEEKEINKARKHAWYLARDKWCPDCRNGKCKPECMNKYKQDGCNYFTVRYALVKEFISGYMECYKELNELKTK